jgi:hypothetical protein
MSWVQSQDAPQEPCMVHQKQAKAQDMVSQSS